MTAESARTWRQANPDKVAAQWRKYYRSLESDAGDLLRQARDEADEVAVERALAFARSGSAWRRMPPNLSRAERIVAARILWERGEAHLIYRLRGFSSRALRALLNGWEAAS